MNYSCFDGLNIPSYLAYSTFLVITNRDFYGLLCFQNTMVIETGLSDFHKCTISSMKSNFHKQKPIITSISIMIIFGMNY